MAQIKIYGVGEHLGPIKSRLSCVFRSCAVDALSFPQDKRAHHFFLLEAEDFRRMKNLIRLLLESAKGSVRGPR
ncbi:MAG: hypothetical protein AVDCRST_MAG28-1602 [uncultured Rubrobacteraceae bacterium]|uniref:Uncharacterized protein n=1 Tax=uncultured Rubrobacteraceae bacterium TaxID=349277 RepID=A0A6J4QBF3_9ACTN|nr:MAG: hypothetical protein AVDCRST_MAG28-1602 [uncultured Rubrobacteraceae bacterium]